MTSYYSYEGRKRSLAHVDQMFFAIKEYRTNKGASLDERLRTAREIVDGIRGVIADLEALSGTPARVITPYRRILVGWERLLTKLEKEQRDTNAQND